MVRLAPDQGDLMLQFAVLDFHDPSRNVMRLKLNGLDEDFGPLSIVVAAPLWQLPWVWLLVQMRLSVMRSANARLQVRVNARTRALAARWGGEEFLIALDGLDSADAVAACEQLRAAFGDCPVAADGTMVSFNATFGVVVSQAGGVSLEDWMRQVDQALYEGKRAGHEGNARGTVGAGPAESRDERGRAFTKGPQGAYSGKF